MFINSIFQQGLEMKGSVLRDEQNENHPEVSSLTKFSHEKLTNGFSTYNMSKERTESQLNSNASLSKLIMNHQEFWAGKFMKHSKESSSEALHLKIQSILSTNSRKMGSFKDLSLKSKCDQNSDAQTSILKNKESPPPPSPLSYPNNSIDYTINQFHYKQPKEMSQLQLSIDDNFTCSHKQRSQSELSIKFEEREERASQIQIINYFLLVQELGLVGHWCSIYLTKTKIRWQNLCILLYIECYRRIEEIYANNDILSKERVGIQQNVIKMIQMNCQLEELVEKLAESGTSLLIFSAIVKDSKKMIDDIMKQQEISNRDVQFCMHKAIGALAILASLNGMSVPNFSVAHDKSELTSQMIKNDLRLYKEIIKFSDRI